MRKRVLLAGVVFAALPLLVSAASCPNLSRNLSFGSRGTDVVELQNFLIAQHDLASGNNSGFFGRLTETAVKKFQCRENIVCSGSPSTTGYGVVGRKTRAAIAQICSSVLNSPGLPGNGYSQSSYGSGYSQGEYYAQSTYNSIYSQGSYYSQASYYSQGTYYAQGSYTPTTTISAPTGLTAQCAANGKSVALSWNAVSGAVNYGIRLTQEGSGVFSEIKDWYPQTSYTSTAIIPGLSWGWWVHANPATGTLGANSNPPSLFTCYPPNPSQTLLVDSFDAYSAEPIYINGALKMYFGGWYKQADLPHDSIFVADCNNDGTSCSNVRKVIDPVPSGYYQINDPSIVAHPPVDGNPPYYIIYMTCNHENTVPAGHDGICYATSYDGITWSAPTLLLENHWLPSAVWKNDHVEVWANDNGNGQQLQMFNLGYSGVSAGSPTPVVQDNVASNSDMNVNVVWRPSLNMYQILAERAVRGNSSVIDYLDSADGIHWNLRHAAVIQPLPGHRVGTPAQHPDTAFTVFFGDTTDLVNSMAFKVYSAQWNASN